MSVVSTAIRRPVTVIVIAFLFVLLGYYSMVGMAVDLFPDINWPVATITTGYEGVAPQEMETLITEPVEDTVTTVEDVKDITSITEEGRSNVVLEFEFGTDMDFASLHIREKLDRTKDSLPDDADDPIVSRFNINDRPVMNVAVMGPDLRTVKDYTEDVLKPHLERVTEVAEARVRGGLDREILVPVRAELLAARGLSITDVADAIERENLNESAGKVEPGRSDIRVRAEGEFESVPEIADVVVRSEGGDQVRVRDLTPDGEVLDTVAEQYYKARFNQRPSVSIQILKESGGNTVRVADGVADKVQELGGQLPSGFEITISSDTSVFIKDSIAMVRQNAVLGAVMAAVVLLVFLRNVRSTGVVLIAVPVSIFATFLPIAMMGMTINLVTLGGLALGVGMVVDNSVVVLENIYRNLRHREMATAEASEFGTTEVAGAILASTLTTLAVFFPIIFVKGIAGEIFGNLAWVIVFALTASIFVAMTVVPTLSARFLSTVARARGESGAPGGVRDNAVLRSYTRLLGWTTAGWPRRVGVVVAFFLLLVFSMKVLSPDLSFFPEMDRGEFTATIELPVGSNLDYTADVSSVVESVLMEQEEVESVGARMGQNESNLSIRLLSLAEREAKGLRSTGGVVAAMRERFAGFPDAEVRFQEERHGGEARGGGAPVEVKVSGDDMDVLGGLTDDVALLLQSVPGLFDIRTSFEGGKPELQIKVDRRKAADLGLSVSSVSKTVRSYVDGALAGTYRDAGDEHDIRVQLLEEDRSSAEDIADLLITTPSGRSVPLRAVADLVLERGPTVIDRSDRQRLGYVWADCDTDRLSVAVGAIVEVLADVPRPTGYSVEFGGQEEERREAFADLTTALIFAIMLVFLILAAQFESFSQPVIVMSSVPMSIIGVFILLKATGVALSIPAYIGIIMLAGIVVNNAILLVDYTNTLRRRGSRTLDALVEAGRVRLRPVVMTASTTVFGMLPLGLGLGSGSEFFQPLALTVIGGLVASTFCTLVLVPTMYALFSGITGVLRHEARGLQGAGPDGAASAAQAG